MILLMHVNAYLHKVSSYLISKTQQRSSTIYILPKHSLYFPLKKLLKFNEILPLLLIVCFANNKKSSFV